MEKDRERIAEVRARHEIGGKKNGGKGAGSIKKEISLGTGGIRSQIKSGRLSLMMFWEESQCHCRG